MNTSTETRAITAGDLRAARARHRVAIYKIAYRAEMHPANLSALFLERAPLKAGVAQKIMAAIEAEAAGAVK